MSNTTDATGDGARKPKVQKAESSETYITINRKNSNKKTEKHSLESLPPELLQMILHDLDQVTRHSIELVSRYLRENIRNMTWHLELKNQTYDQIQRLYSTLTNDEYRRNKISSIRINLVQAQKFTVNNHSWRLQSLLDVGRQEEDKRKPRDPLRIATASRTSNEIKSMDNWNQVFWDIVTNDSSVEALLAGIIIITVKLRKLELIAGHDLGDFTVLELLNSYAETMHKCNRIAFPAMKIMHVRPMYPRNVNSEIIVYRNITELRITLPTKFNHDIKRIALRPGPDGTNFIKKISLTGFTRSYRIVRDFLTQGQARFCEELEVTHQAFTICDAPVSDLVDALASNCNSLRRLSIGSRCDSQRGHPSIKPLSLDAFSRPAFSQLTYLALERAHVMKRSSLLLRHHRLLEGLFAPFFMMLPRSVKHARLGGLSYEDVMALVYEEKTENPFTLCQKYCLELRSLRLTVEVWYSPYKARRTGLNPHKAKMNDFALLASVPLEVGWYTKNVSTESPEERFFVGSLSDSFSTSNT